MKKILNSLLDLIYRKKCYFCRKSKYSQKMCPECYNELDFGDFSANRVIDGVDIFCAGVYKKELQMLIRGLKYHGQKDLAYYQAKFMYEYWEKFDFEGDFQVVAVPQHKKRNKKYLLFLQLLLFLALLCRRFQFHHLLKDFTALEGSSDGASYHHERYDGKGYGKQLAGENIPLVARIIGVADAYDAMASKRSYRDVLPQNVVREEIAKGSGSQFDPKFAEIMLRMIDEDTEYRMRE